MACKQSLLVLLPITGLLAAFITGVVGRQTQQSDYLITENLASVQNCSSESELSAAVQTLASGKYAEQQKAVALLKNKAKLSSTCRAQVISRLLSAMDQPNLDLAGGTPQFYIWHYGIQVLGELKAVEALDLLIANFDRHDGTPFPLNHHPAIGGVIDMGEIALPKLQGTLRENPDRYTRRYAVFCIALIGGHTAEKILTQAVGSESDPCVASCIRASLTSFKNKRRPQHISDEGRTEWYTTFLCNGE